MTSNRPVDLGYYKLVENSTGYFTVTFPKKAVERAGLTAGDDLHAIFNPIDKSTKFVPEVPLTKKRRGTP
jgi:hypothetical protein